MSLTAQIEQYLKQLAEETEQAKQSQSFKSYLATMSKFWDYSCRNQLLIHIQSPNATKVAGYHRWKQLKRTVRKGEKGIRIMAPIVRTTNNEEEIFAFKPATVFDVSQTEGEPLPDMDIDIKGNDKQDILNKLMQYCARLSVKIEFKPLSDDLYGYNSNGLIAINNTKSPNTQAGTLIHEIAHEILHKNNNSFNKQQREIQAEAVAYAVSKCLGLESKGFNYLALYDADYKKIMENLSIISEASKKIMSETGKARI